MSNYNPPFRISPLYEEENDFSFPIQAPNDSQSQPVVDEESIDYMPPNSLQPKIISQPNLDYQDHLSIFPLIGQFPIENFPLIRQFPTTQEETTTTTTTSDWVAQLEQVGLDHHVQLQDNGVSSGGGGGGGGGGEGPSSSVKKVDQNVKEKMRRMKLNDFYLKLRSLLPQSQKAKERWTAPYIIDRAMEYIPRFQAEIDKLTLEKSTMLSLLGKKQILITSDDHVTDQEKVHKDSKQTTLTVSINEVKRGEVIVQICQQLKGKVPNYFSSLIEKLEGQGMLILGASTQRACEDRSCFHLLVQMCEFPFEANYVEDLQKKLISWLS